MTVLLSDRGSTLTSVDGELCKGLSRFSSFGMDFDFRRGLEDLGDRPRVLLFPGLRERDLFLDRERLSRDLDLRGLLDRLGLLVRERVLERLYLLLGGDLRLLSSYLLRPLRPLDLDLLNLSLLRDLDRDFDLDLPRDGDLRRPLLSSLSRSESDFLDR